MKKVQLFSPAPRHYPVLLIIFLINVKILAQPAELKHPLGKPNRTSGMIVINTAINITDGDPAFLAAINRCALKFDYSRMGVCDYENEDIYLRAISEKWNAAKTEKHIAAWKALRAEQFEPGFEKYFNLAVAPRQIIASKDTATEVTLVVEPLKLEPDEHKSLPYVYMFCTFNDSKGRLLARYEITAFGSRDDNKFDRASECFRIAAKMLGKKLVKDLKAYPAGSISTGQ